MKPQHTRAFICDDCIYIFVVYEKPRRGKQRRLFCPNCGENHSVQPYTSVKKDGKDNIQVSYKPHEDEVIRQAISGEITRIQAAYILGRTLGSVRHRFNLLKKKDGANGSSKETTEG